MRRTLNFYFAYSFAILIALISGVYTYGQMPGMPQSRHHAWSDTSLSPDVRADLVIKELTLDEKIQLLHGLGWLATVMPPESGPGRGQFRAWDLFPGFSGWIFLICRCRILSLGFQEPA